MSGDVYVGISVVAGCTFATTLLRVVLLKCGDIMRTCYPQVDLYVYVDDIDPGMEGDEQGVAITLGGAMRSLVTMLQHGVPFPGVEYQIPSIGVYQESTAEALGRAWRAKSFPGSLYGEKAGHGLLLRHAASGADFEETASQGCT